MQSEKKLHLFTTCLANSLFPDTAEAVVRVLNLAGFFVEYLPEQTCCGQMAFNAGFAREARDLAKFNIRIWEQTEGPIVLPSGSCTAMIRHHYPELLEAEPEWLRRARNLAGRVFELTEFLVEQACVIEFGARYKGKVAYHPSCHLLRMLGIDSQPKSLLRSVEGLELLELEPVCCGFGGVFAEDHSVISNEMLNRKIVAIEESGAELVTGADLSCLMHIKGGLLKKGSAIEVRHIAEILAGGVDE